MSLLIVCPVILPPRAEVLDTWTHRPHLCVINGNHDEWEQVCEERGLLALRMPDNAGCPRSWNLGFELARDAGIDHVAIVSQSLELDPPGTELLAEYVEEFGDERGLQTNWSFHAVVFSVALWERVGRFDEGLPIFCDTDYAQRLHAAGERTPSRPMPVAFLDGRSQNAATISAGMIPPDSYDLDRSRYVAKWGEEPCDPCSPPAPTPTPLDLETDLSLEERRGLAHEYLPGGLLAGPLVARTTDYQGVEVATARWTAYLPGLHAHALTSDECDTVLRAASGSERGPGRRNVGADYSVGAGPASYASHLTAGDPALEAVVMRVVRAAEAANREWWRFDISGLEQAHVLRYVAGDDASAHTDASPLYPSRKLSMLVPLSDPSEYEGGTLEMMHDHTVTRPPLERGAVIVLPAYLLHRVTPVTAGSRSMLVMFLEGPPFK